MKWRIEQLPGESEHCRVSSQLEQFYYTTSFPAFLLFLSMAMTLTLHTPDQHWRLSSSFSSSSDPYYSALHHFSLLLAQPLSPFLCRGSRVLLPSIVSLGSSTFSGQEDLWNLTSLLRCQSTSEKLPLSSWPHTPLTFRASASHRGAGCKLVPFPVVGSTCLGFDLR